MRAKLGKFGLSGQHHLTPICKLSGGQKARVVFTAISLMQVRCWDLGVTLWTRCGVRWC